MDRERLDDWCERGILALVLAALVYSPLALGAVRAQEFLVVQWLAVGVLALWLTRHWINPKQRLFWPWLCWPALLFIAYAVGRYARADIEYVARQELMRVLVYAVFFFAVLNNLHRLETTQVVGMTLVFLGMGISLYALYQFITDSSYVWHLAKPQSYRQRGSGTFICPNHLAGYLEMILPLALAYTLTGRFGYVTKILLCYASLALFTGITVSISRGGWVATGLTLVVMFLWLLRQRDYRLQSTLVGAGLLVVAVVFFFKAQLSANRYEQLTLAGHAEDFRFRLWAPAVRMWKDHVWWGVGPGHFDHRFREYRPAHPDLQMRPDRVHNDYLNSLTDWGVVGTSLVAAVWLLFFIEAGRSWRFVQRAQNDFTAKRSTKSSFVMGGTLGLVAILLHSVVDFNMHIPSNALLAVTLMALVAGHFRFATEQHWHTLRLPLQLAMSVVIGAGLLFLCYHSARGTGECYWLARAKRSAQYSAAELAALQKARAFDPRNADTMYEIGENFRLRSWGGAADYPKLAQEATNWYQRSIDLNPYDPHPYLRYGMCLDWLGKHMQAEDYFKRASRADPNGYYTAAHVGWHYVQKQDYAVAKSWFERSLYLKWSNNRIASSYLTIANRRLEEAAQGK